MTTDLTVSETRHQPGSWARRLGEALLRRGTDASTSGWVKWIATTASVTGSALIVTTAAIHIHLWLSGYRDVRTLGVLFLAQAISGFVLGPIIALGRQAALVLMGALFMASSAGGLILSATVGFVGIHDGLDVPWATPSLAVELAGFLLLSAASAIQLAPLFRSSD
jgi:hypothetical protein